MTDLNSLLEEFDSSPSEPTPSERHWSIEQLAVYDSEDPLLIPAVAGSGKTTTLIEKMNRLLGNSIFLAFNKAIAMDIGARASGDVKTLNALGHARWMGNRRAAKLDAKKSLGLLKPLMSQEDYTAYGYTLSRLIGLAKNQAMGLEGGEPVMQSGFEDLIDSFQMDIPCDQVENMANLAMIAFEKGRKDLDTFDFDDQLYIPLQEKWDFPSYSNVLVDECQDLSPIQHHMLTVLKHAGDSRLICVGDRHQAIYGFRGASTNSMNELRDQFKLVELPLSTTYRCPLDVVEVAQRYCPTIFPAPGAKRGQVHYMMDNPDAQDPELFSEALIICRNNAPLFRAILRHVRAKSPCTVLTNFLESFQGFIRSFKTTYTSDLRSKLDNWFEREKSAALAKNFRGKVAGLRDKYETACLLAAEFKRTEDVLELVRRLGQGTSGPTFSTIHKAKGLEHSHVYLMRPDLCPSKYAETPEAKQQEENLIYVAITRAKDTLTFGVEDRK